MQSCAGLPELLANPQICATQTNMTDTLIYVAMLVPCLIIAIVFHEVAHGAVALMLGDRTAHDLGRLSLNPIRHVDPMGTLIVPGLLALVSGPIFGWAKPVPVKPSRLNNPRYGMMLVAAAGPASNLLMAMIAAIVLGVIVGIAGPDSALPQWLFQLMILFIMVNTFLALFNLLPIPPFDGSHIVGGLLPRRMVPRWQQMQQVGIVFIVILIAITWAFPGSGIIERVVLPPVQWMQEYYLGLAQRVAALFG